MFPSLLIPKPAASPAGAHKAPEESSLFISGTCQCEPVTVSPGRGGGGAWNPGIVPGGGHGEQTRTRQRLARLSEASDSNNVHRNSPMKGEGLAGPGWARPCPSSRSSTRGTEESGEGASLPFSGPQAQTHLHIREAPPSFTQGRNTQAPAPALTMSSLPNPSTPFPAKATTHTRELPKVHGKWN